MKKMNNKGFSLVELIVVIAIMAVLVGVLAPQFIKYVESSRRSTDVSNAEAIRSAVLADIAEAKILGTGTGSVCTTTAPSTIGEVPKIKGNVGTLNGTDFTYSWNASTGVCYVYAGTYNLSDTTGVSSYKAQ